jgi:hypothetical protein
MDLENEISTSWTLFGSGTPVYKNGGKLEVDEPQLPPLTITPKAKPAGDTGMPTIKPPTDVMGIPEWGPEADANAKAGEMLVRSIGAGLRDTAQQTLNLGGEIIDYATEKATGQPAGAFDYVKGAIPEIKTDSTAEEIVRLVTNVGSAIFLTRGVGLRGAVVNSAAVDALMDPTQGNLSSMAKELGFSNELLDFMDSKVGDEATAEERLTARLKNVLEGAGIGGLLSTVVRGFKEIKADPAAAAKVAGGLLVGDTLLNPDEAQAGVLQRLARSAKGTITKLGKAEGETATQFIERMNREAPIVTNADEFVKTYGDVPAVSAAQPSDAVAWRMAQNKDTVPVLPTGQMGEKTTAASPFAQIGGYFDSLVRMKNGGLPREWSNPEHARQIIDEAAAEVKYQLALGDPRKKDFTQKTGWGWYDEDTQRMFNTASKTMPELGMNSKRGVKVPWGDGTDNVTPEQSRILLAAVGAPQSFGNPAKRNADIALQAYEVFRKTGQFPEKGIFLNSAGAVESTGSYWTQRAVSQQYIGVLNTLIREVGPAKAADWLVSPHSIAELRDLKRRAVDADGEKIFKGDTSMGISGKADEIKPGAFVFGPKGGQFMGNLLGFPGTTTDMWFTRSWNRYLGKSREGVGALSETGLVEQPRNLGERADMADFSRQLTDKLNQDQDLVAHLGRPMTERDTQAVLWYFEQFLYNEMGVKVKPTSFGEGASAYAKRAKQQGGTGIAPR